MTAYNYPDLLCSYKFVKRVGLMLSFLTTNSTKGGHKETLRGDSYVYYLDCGGTIKCEHV